MVAIIDRAVHDAASIIRLMRPRAKRSSNFASSVYAQYNPQAISHANRSLEALKTELKHPWFGEICRYVGIHQDRVLRHIKKLEERAMTKHGS